MRTWHQEAKRLRAEGLTYREIGERLGVAKSSAEHAVKTEPSTTYRGAREGMTLEDRERRRTAVAALRGLQWSTRRIGRDDAACPLAGGSDEGSYNPERQRPANGLDALDRPATR